MKTLQIAAAAGFFAASLAGAALAQDTSGSMMSPAPAAAPSAMESESPMAPSAATSAANSSATAMASGATVTQTTVTNGPVPDTPDNRAKYGGPMSRTGKHTKPAGN